MQGRASSPCTSSPRARGVPLATAGSTTRRRPWRWRSVQSSGASTLNQLTEGGAMITAWMLYSVGISAVLGVCAFALEHGLRRRGVPVRWLWAAALLASLVLAALPWGAPRPLAPAGPAPRPELVVMMGGARDLPAHLPRGPSPARDPSWRGGLRLLEWA